MRYIHARARPLLAAALLVTFAPALHAQDPGSGTSPPAAILRGDVDGDGRVTTADAAAVRAYLVRGTLPPGRAILPAGDANGDGRVTAADAALIARFAAGVDVSRFAVGGRIAPGGRMSPGTVISTEYECTADFKAGTLQCGVLSPEGPTGVQLDVMLYPTAAKAVNTGGGAYSGADKSNPDTMTYNIALLNLISQPLGTRDGVTADTSRLVITNYQLTSPTPATAQLANADGTATFVDSTSAGPPKTYSSKEYRDYTEVIAQNDTSSSKFYQFVFSPSVTQMRFTYRIWARVQYPNGWITLAPGTTPVLNPGTQVTFTGTVYDYSGQTQTDSITWSSSNPAVATVDANTGQVTAVAVGVATITATSKVKAQRTGARDITVTNVNTWEGDVSSNWQTAGNWDAGVVPTSTTVAIIPAAGTLPNLPVLTANAQVLDLTVGSARTLGLGGFTLQAGGDVTATGTISNGVLQLTGADADWQGTVDDVVVSGAGFVASATRATGPISVTGSLSVATGPLSIATP
ncbi:MAG TPA: Ig-like domain-containing protein [Longimicrobium sp.]|nr:Ig-like domain-containing protein [Longimicrobium sp.]